MEADEPDNTLAALRRIRELGKKSGLSLKPGTPAEAVTYKKRQKIIMARGRII